MCRGCMSSNPSRTADEKFASWILLATNDEKELDDLCPTEAAEVVENLSEDNEKGVDFESRLEEQNQ